MNAAPMSSERLWRAYLAEISFEFVKSLRTPAFAVPTLVFPVMFYVLFGIVLGSMRGNAAMATYTFAAYGVFGAMGPGLFGFGVSLAIEREQGLLTLKQALPAPRGVYLLARAAMAMLFVAIIAVMLMALAVLVADVPLTASQAAQILLIDVLGALPFCAIGMYVGSLVSGQASPAIVNLIFLPMAFLSGLWLPLDFMPQVLRDLAPLWPAWHLAQLALAAVGAPSEGTAGVHVAVLVGVAAVFLALAIRRMDGRRFRLGRTRSPAVTVAFVAVLALAAGVIVNTFLGGKALAATAAADAVDLPAPAAGVIADFDDGSAQAKYGTGWMASDDKLQGGQSQAAVRVIDGGAAGTAHALEIAGTLRSGAEHAWGGAMFFPVDPPMQGIIDYSTIKTLSFATRGDGATYYVMLWSGQHFGSPAIREFTAGTEWRSIEVPLDTFAGADLARVRAIGFMAANRMGDFRFEIDSVRLD